MYRHALSGDTLGVILSFCADVSCRLVCKDFAKRGAALVTTISFRKSGKDAVQRLSAFPNATRFVDVHDRYKPVSAFFEAIQMPEFKHRKIRAIHGMAIFDVVLLKELAPSLEEVSFFINEPSESIPSYNWFLCIPKSVTFFLVTGLSSGTPIPWLLDVVKHLTNLKLLKVDQYIMNDDMLVQLCLLRPLCQMNVRVFWDSDILLSLKELPFVPNIPCVELGLFSDVALTISLMGSVLGAVLTDCEINFYGSFDEEDSLVEASRVFGQNCIHLNSIAVDFDLASKEFFALFLSNIISGSKIKSLKLTNSSLFYAPNSDIDLILPHLSCLKSLVLDTASVSDMHLGKLVSAAPLLESISLRNSQISNASIMSLPKRIEIKILLVEK